MRRDIFSDEHVMFRTQVRRFVENELVPKIESWNRAGMSDRESWRKMGEAGFLGANAPAEYGGAGGDFLYDAIVIEELSRVRAHGLMMGLHSDIIMPYLASYGSEALKRRYLTRAISGETILAIAMSEPEAGSDLQGIKTTALRDGDHYVLNGTKTFISSGMLADLVVVVARTDRQAGARGLSLLVVERDMDGFERGRNLDKVGLKAMDTAELFFRDVRVPVTNLLGAEGGGFGHLMANLPQERLNIAVSAVAAAEASYEMTLQYGKSRTAFGQPIGRFQHAEEVKER